MKQQALKILSPIRRLKRKIVQDIFVPPFRYDSRGGIIWDNNNNRVLDVRGWGHLTGTGAMRLSSEDAYKRQDEFGKWVADAMNEKANKQP